MKGTRDSSGHLANIPNCSITIPTNSQTYTVNVNALPDLGDKKSAAYADEPVLGRSFPLKTFSHGENRAIPLTLHFYIVSKDDLTTRLQDLRAIQSALYPRDSKSGNTPFFPPAVCTIRCGKLLGDDPLCVILRSCSVTYPTDVVWIEDNGSYFPMKFDVQTEWETVYKVDALPGQDQIFQSGD